MRARALVLVAAIAAASCAQGGSRSDRRALFDSGAPPTDSGSSTPDADRADTGTAPTDGGTALPDSGPPPTDAGPRCDTAGCSPAATCDDSSGVAVCTCSAGYTGDGLTCADVDECVAGTAGCDANATCTNTDGAFMCTCDAGYTGDGMTCADVDECVAGTAGCGANATCTNTAGSFTCVCNAGYTGDGFTCTPVGPTCTTLADFETGSFPVSPWVASPGGGSVSASAAHDGTYGITDPDWYYETAMTVGSTGDRLRAWVRPGTGRAYFGFAASASGCKTFVAAPNTGDIRFQDNAGFGYTELSTSSTSFTAGQWYLMEIRFLGSGTVEGRLYASDGSTLVNSVTHSFGSLPVGGVCMRTFGTFALDTIQICR